MSHAYADKKQTPKSADRAGRAAKTSVPDPLRTGVSHSAAGQKGRRVDLPDVMREKMENAFGADLSAVRLYESEAVADAGASAITQGSDIAFAPGALDFTSYGGRALLGHEISHVVSQARGEVTGGGFLNDRALEARADREGAMAAAGQTVAMPTAAMSPVSAASAAGPMQAKKPWQKKRTDAPFMKVDPKKAGKVNQNQDLFALVKNATYDPEDDNYTEAWMKPHKGAEQLAEQLMARYNSEDYREPLGVISNGSDVRIRGLGLNRMVHQVAGTLGEGYSNDEIIQMYDDMMAPHRSDLNRDDPQAVGAANDQFMRGLKTLKGMQLRHLRRMQKTFGTLGTQMHPADFSRQVGRQFKNYFSLTQDTAQMLKDAPKSILDPENDPEDAEYKNLQAYYGRVADRNITYAQMNMMANRMQSPLDEDLLDAQLGDPEHDPEADPALLASIHGPSMTPKQEAAYRAGLQKRAKTDPSIGMFGKFRRRGTQ